MVTRKKYETLTNLIQTHPSFQEPQQHARDQMSNYVVAVACIPVWMDHLVDAEASEWTQADLASADVSAQSSMGSHCFQQHRFHQHCHTAHTDSYVRPIGHNLSWQSVRIE